MRYQSTRASELKSKPQSKRIRVSHAVVSALSLAVVMIAFMAASVSATSAPEPVASAQNAPAATLIATGQQQLQAARTANTEEAYRVAEATFDRAVQLDAKDPMARLYLGLALAPDNLQVRLSRGSSYAEFPSFLNKGTLAREDLEVVVHHPRFAAQTNDLRARAHYTLGRVYAAGGESEKARASWQAAVAASPQSREGQLARAELEKLGAPVVAADAAGRRMPDRFPKISIETFPNHRGDWTRESLPESMKNFLAKLEKQPGLLGVHALSSVDNRGMLVILTWWENKKALNDWFYSEAHQAIIGEFYGKGKPGAGPLDSKTPTGGMGQVGVELFTPLPGGMVFGGGLAPTPRKKQ
jgi:tetratricopeptide (TPR) repeat protein